MSEVNLTINGKPLTVPAGTTIFEAAQSMGEKIPAICYHEACTANGLCRLCVVEVEGARVLTPACVERAREGMAIQTRSDRVERSRRTILEMLNSAVDLSEAPDIQTFMEDYAADCERFPGSRRRDVAILDDNPMYIRDYTQCVLCWRCVQVCAEDAQYTFALNFKGRGYETQIGTFFDKPMPQTSCVFCGQCIGVCPTGALKPKREWLLEQGKTTDEVLQATHTKRRKKRRG